MTATINMNIFNNGLNFTILYDMSTKIINDEMTINEVKEMLKTEGVDEINVKLIDRTNYNLDK